MIKIFYHVYSVERGTFLSYMTQTKGYFCFKEYV